MARDMQAAVIALDRFGFGARGGASGDLLNAASDPRGFIKAELSRPNAVAPVVPGLQTTPALTQAVFGYQDEQKAKREAAAKTVAAARINGTGGTDHGTGTIALLAGGAVKGGRVIADWPGLKAPNLHEGRDLAPTCDLRAALKGVLRDHLGLAEGVLAQRVFPDSAQVKPIQGLVG